MKKILLIIIIIFLTGCYNYTEINDLAFISSIGIDYNKTNEKFIVTYEILNDNSTGEGKINKSYTISAEGKNITDAFNNTSLKVNNKPYFYHLKIIAIDETISKKHMKDVVDYILRNPDVKNEFFLILIKNAKAKDILDKSDEVDPDIGNKIYRMIKSNEDQNNISIDQNFEATTRFFANNLSNALLNTFTLNDKDEIIELGLSAFKEYEYVKTLTNEESALFNLIVKGKASLTLNKKEDDKIISVNIYSGKGKIEIKDSEVIYNIDALGEIKVNTTNINLKDEKAYHNLNDEFKKILNEKLLKFIEVLKNDNLDILEVNNLYYEKTRKEMNIFKSFDFKLNTNIKIDKKGLIFNFEN